MTSKICKHHSILTHTHFFFHLLVLCQFSGGYGGLNILLGYCHTDHPQSHPRAPAYLAHTPALHKQAPSHHFTHSTATCCCTSLAQHTSQDQVQPTWPHIQLLTHTWKLLIFIHTQPCAQWRFSTPKGPHVGSGQSQFYKHASMFPFLSIPWDSPLVAASSSTTQWPWTLTCGHAHGFTQSLGRHDQTRRVRFTYRGPLNSTATTR